VCSTRGMPGGPKRLEAREYEPLPRPVKALELSEEEKRWDAAMVVWRSARRFQRLAKRLSHAAGVSFARWQVLEPGRAARSRVARRMRNGSVSPQIFSQEGQKDRRWDRGAVLLRARAASHKALRGRKGRRSRRILAAPVSARPSVLLTFL